MQIEETFRDLKSHRWGFGLRYARSHSPRRLETLLLVAALASFVVWLLGLAAISLGRHHRLQANTVRSRPVLSTFFIGRQLVDCTDQELPRAAIADALHALQARFRDPVEQ